VITTLVAYSGDGVIISEKTRQDFENVNWLAFGGWTGTDMD
jgi:hypothetical protein